jgi:hypothetical protein
MTNTVAGKGYQSYWGIAYHFIDENHVFRFLPGVGTDPAGWTSGEYEIKNYVIFVKNARYHYPEVKQLKQEKFTVYVCDFEDTNTVGVIPYDEGEKEFTLIPLESYEVLKGKTQYVF